MYVCETRNKSCYFMFSVLYVLAWIQGNSFTTCPIKNRPPKYQQIRRYVTKRFEQSSFIYISNYHIVYLSLTKQELCSKISFQDMTSNVNLNVEPFFGNFSVD